MRELTFAEFRDLSRKQQIDLLEKFIDGLDERFLKGVIIKGHSSELHAGQSEQDLLNRTMRDGKSSSTFDGAGELSWNIKENLFYLVPQIRDWLVGTNGPMNNSEFRQKTFDIPIMAEGDYDSKYCKGITTDLELKETNMAKLVLARNLDVYTQEGMFFFYVKTVYPDLNHPQARSLGRNLRKEAEELYNEGILYKGVRKQLPELQKAYWAFKFMDCKPFTYTNIETNKLIVPFNINGKSFSATFTNESENHLTPIISVNIGTDKPHYVSLKKSGIDNETIDKALSFGQELMKVFKSAVNNETVDELLSKYSLRNFKEEVDYKLHSSDYKQAKHQVKSSLNDFAMAK